MGRFDFMRQPKVQESEEGEADSEGTVAEPSGSDFADLESAADAGEAEVLSGPAGFQRKLDRLDELIAEDNDIGPMTIDSVRKYVMQIMIDLKEQPELDSCIIDRDVHNVLAFIRATKVDAVETRETAKIKREKREAGKRKGPKKGFNFGDGPFGGGGGVLNPDSMKDLSNLDF